MKLLTHHYNNKVPSGNGIGTGQEDKEECSSKNVMTDRREHGFSLCTFLFLLTYLFLYFLIYIVKTFMYTLKKGIF